MYNINYIQKVGEVMQKEILFDKIKHGISQIHDNIFKEIEVNEILDRNDQNVNAALDRYLQYFNYYENQQEYNLDFCFKTTVNDLNEFYNYQEIKLDKIRNNEKLYNLEHKVNEHIYDEIVSCQKRVNRIYSLNTFTSYFLAFLLIFGITQITHIVELNTMLGTMILAIVLAFVKIFIDKRYLEVIRNKVGWKSYRNAIKRSLAFYFASVIILNKCEHNQMESFSDELLVEFKKQVRETIDILLDEIII